MALEEENLPADSSSKEGGDNDEDVTMEDAAPQPEPGLRKFVIIPLQLTEEQRREYI